LCTLSPTKEKTPMMTSPIALAPSKRQRAFSSGPLAAPTEFQLWRPGPNPTDYGVHVWSERSAREVMARYNARGNPLLIDVEHNGAKLEGGEPSTTGGYARLELRNGAPWLVFAWSAYAVDQIATGQRRFLSPEYDIDRSTGEILGVVRVSLVADPGTHNARLLASAPTVRMRASATTRVSRREYGLASIAEIAAMAVDANRPEDVRGAMRNTVVTLTRAAATDEQRIAASAALRRIDMVISVSRAMGIPMRPRRDGMSAARAVEIMRASRGAR
jgi:phage I-like protein